ncbi:MAG: hypothetical protein AB8B96_20350 [Lysobacterales bacterium]
MLGMLLAPLILLPGNGDEASSIVRNPGAPYSANKQGPKTEPTPVSGQAQDNSPTIAQAALQWPTEWRTRLNNDQYLGYAILLDPGRGDVIVEQCRHLGYFDDAVGKPIDLGNEFCTPVLQAKLTELTQTSARAMRRDGSSVDLSLSVGGDEDQPELTLSFPGHTMNLIAGSKNDLRQAMDNTPEMKSQKAKRNAYLFGKKADRSTIDFQ